MARRFHRSALGQPIFDQAKRVFGTTDDYREAGYILPDGSLLDFSGRRQGSTTPGHRYMDHREVILAFGPQARAKMKTASNYFQANPGSIAMLRFMDAGAVRISKQNGTTFLDIVKRPTPEQRSVLREVLRESEEAIVDVTRPDTGTVVIQRLWGGPGQPHVHPDAIVSWMTERGLAGLRRRRGLGAPQHITQDASSLERCSIPAEDFQHGQGFILPSGSIISLPQGHQHIVRCLSQDTRDMYARSGRGWNGAVDDAIRAGLIRIVYGPHNGLWVESIPGMTSSQERVLRGLAEDAENIHVDVADPETPDGLLRYKVWEPWQRPSPAGLVTFIRRGPPPVGRLGQSPRVAFPAGTPEGRLKFHWDPYKFKIALRKAEKCGKLEKECHTKADRWGGRLLTTCTWRTRNGRIVAAAAGNATREGSFSWTSRSTSLWTDRALLAGRCPEEDR